MLLMRIIFTCNDLCAFLHLLTPYRHVQQRRQRCIAQNRYASGSITVGGRDNADYYAHSMWSMAAAMPYARKNQLIVKNRGSLLWPVSMNQTGSCNAPNALYGFLEALVAVVVYAGSSSTRSLGALGALRRSPWFTPIRKLLKLEK